jgi:hypothetical protein
MKKHFLILFLSALMAVSSMAQEVHCNMIKLSTVQLVQSSELMVRARVIERQSIWNTSKTKIYTVHHLLVLESYKGNPNAELTLITEGGDLPELSVEFSDRIDLFTGDEAVLLLNQIPGHWKGLPSYPNAFCVGTSLEGVFMVNPINRSVTDIFDRFNNIDELKRSFQNISGETARIFISELRNNLPETNGSTAATISTLSPTVITAGTKSILTINGTGFGATRGTGFVEFTTALGTFAQPFAKDYISWNDNQIRVMVPSRLVGQAADNAAASGQVRVTPSAGAVATSAGSITVKYALFNVPIAAGDTAAVMNAGNFNTLGGYTLQFNNQFNATFTTEGRETFLRALNKWLCATRFNWTISTTESATRSDLNDGINVITDDVLSPLPANVLGRGINYVSACGSGNATRAITIGQDIVFNNLPGGFAWNFGSDAPTASEIDFETTALHELGHLHQLAHTKNTSAEVMAATVGAGFSRKNLTQNDIDAGLDVMARSSVSVGCGVSAHLPIIQTVSISTSSVFPICSESQIYFTSTTTNVQGTPNLVWKRNGIISGSGSIFFFSNPQNNEIITCELQGCTTSASNVITVTTTPTQHIGGPLCVAGQGSITETYIANFNQPTGPGTGGDLIIPEWILSPGITIANPNSTVATITFSPTFTSGTIRARYYSNACSANIDASINVVRGPSASISYSQTSYCKNVTIPRTVANTGATNGTYSSTPAGLTIDSSTGAITPSTSTVGTYTISYTLPASGNCGPFTASTTVTIVNTPLAIIQFLNPNFCRSNTGTVTPALISPAGGTFTSTPAGLSLNASTGGIRPSLSTAGTYTYTYTIENSGGCGAFSASRSITILNQLATPGAIAGTTTGFCNTSRTFSVGAVAGASSYQWTIPAGTTISGNATGNSIVLVAGAGFTGGTLSVRAIASNGCNSNLRSTTLSTAVPAQPGTITKTGATIFSANGTASVANVTGATSYTWTATGATITGGQGTRNATFTITNLNSYTLCVRANNNCGSSANRCSTFTVPLVAPLVDNDYKLPGDNSELSARSIPTLFPNPATDIINVKFEEDWMGESIQAEIVGVDGKVYQNKQVIPSEDSAEETDISELPKGIYMLRLSSSSSYTTLRFIKQ